MGSVVWSGSSAAPAVILLSSFHRDGSVYQINGNILRLYAQIVTHGEQSEDCLWNECVIVGYLTAINAYYYSN